MTSAAPAGPPSIRTDWLADVAWRLAAFGLERWRTLDAEHVAITDVVDGRQWHMKPAIWSPATEAVCEFDGDLRQPADQDQPSLRIGGSVAAVFDDKQGCAVRVRIEIGPRGPVTFDPENWVYTFPVQALDDGGRPTVEGLSAGEIEPGPPGDRAPHATEAAVSLDRAGAVWLGDLVELAEGRRSWHTVLAAAETVHRPRRFGVGPKRLAEPYATLTLQAEGELRITPDGLLTASDFAEVQPLESIALERDRVVLKLAADRSITISGTGLRVTTGALDGSLSGD